MLFPAKWDMNGYLFHHVLHSLTVFDLAGHILVQFS